MTHAEFETAFDAHRDAVYRFAWRMSGPAVAEDVTQEVFLSLLTQPDRFDPARGTLRAFLLGVARNVMLKRWRDEHRWESLDEEDPLAAAPLETDGREIADLVAAAVRSLPPLQREVVILAEYEECSLDEIARAVDAEIGTVKSRLHRARARLRRMLAPIASARYHAAERR